MNKSKTPQDVLEKAIELFSQKEQRRKKFIDEFGYMRPPNMFKAWGKTFTTIEGGIYQQIREGEYNFITLIHDLAILFLGGNEFLDVEESKLFSERHIAIQWMHTHINNRLSNLNAGVPELEIDHLGAGVAWLRFAYDLHTIRDNAKLGTILKNRLLSPTTFQSARHELRVAAICIAAGFTIEFEDETDNKRPHPEFIAVDTLSSLKIAVEAKSKHRRGVLGFTQGSHKAIGSTVNISDLVTSAYKKAADIPYYVFVDVNLPPYKDTAQWNIWLTEIDNSMLDLDKAGLASPCPANVVFFTNDPSHYVLDRPINDETDNLWIKYVQSVQPKIPHPLIEVRERLMRAHNQRTSPPVDIPNFNQ